MSKVEEIERAIQELTPQELANLKNWFEEYQTDAWDRQIEEDAKAGRLDWLVEEARADLDAGRVRDL